MKPFIAAYFDAVDKLAGLARRSSTNDMSCLRVYFVGSRTIFRNYLIAGTCASAANSRLTLRLADHVEVHEAAVGPKRSRLLSALAAAFGGKGAAAVFNWRGSK
jgi:hypothetical protein